MERILAKYASTVFDETFLDVPLNWVYLSLFEDDVLLNAELFSGIKRPETLKSEELRLAILSDEVLSKIFKDNDNLGPMLFTPLGGSRINYEQTIIDLFSTAFLKMYYFGIERLKERYIESVLCGFNEFRNMVIHKTAKVYYISGLGRIKNSGNNCINTVFGKIVNKPKYEIKKPFFINFKLYTNCLLISEKEVPVEILFGNDPIPSINQNIEKIDYEKLQIGFALASNDYLKPCMPSVNWNTHFFDFMKGNSVSLPSAIYYHDEQDIANISTKIEYWINALSSLNLSKIEIAIDRICSAIGKREDPRDSLIDAVMSWENMFGTHDEVTYRVCTAISKLLKSNYEERSLEKQKLTKLYGKRSRIVHGDSIKKEEIKESSKEAIKTALESLSKLLEKGNDYLALGSEKRSDRIICE
jgi:uncharacterized protein YutE (UPF0331/DUF86 family)